MAGSVSSARTRVLGVGLSATALLVALTLWLGPDGAPASPSAFGQPGAAGLQGHLPPEVGESSGVAVSRSQVGVLWTHNDGPSRTLFAVGLDGSPRGQFHLSGVDMVDWEDIALGPCPGSDTTPAGARGDCLFVADIGDNRAARPYVAIYVVPEPTLGPDSSQPAEIGPSTGVRISYAEGPADAEALAVTPEGDLVLVTKGEGGPARLYVIQASELGAAAGGSSPIRLSSRMVLPIPTDRRANRVTGAAVSPEAGTLAVRTHDTIYLFTTDGWTDLPRACPIQVDQPQGEAVDYLEGDLLVLTTEARGRPAPIATARCSID